MHVGAPGLLLKLGVTTSCHCLGFSSVFFFIKLIMFLLLASTLPFAWA
jgi:hypothetical protein